MSNTAVEKTEQSKRYTSIKQKFLVFSIVLFSIILLGGSIAFGIAMMQIYNKTTGNELAKSLDIERIKLEASVNAEIAIALKMAASPIIIQHFLNMDDLNLKRLAFDEIEGYRKAFASGTAFWAGDADKEFYFAEDNHYTIDIENPDNYWYIMTLHETEKYNFNINFNPEIQKTMLWINAPVFDNRRTPIGLVGTGIDLSEFINAIYKSYTGDAELYLFNNLNEITGARDIDLVANKVTLDKAYGQTGQDILEKIKELKNSDIISFETPDYEVAVGEVKSLDWYIVAVYSPSILAVFTNTMTVVFLAMLAVIAAILVIFMFLISWMLKPLNQMIVALDHISTSWDLTEQLKIRHKDETGVLGEFFNMTFGKMRGLILEIKAKILALQDTGEELASHTKKTKADIDGINSNMQGMRGQILTQADKVNAAANSMDRINTGLAALNDHISIQADSVARSSSAIEEMLANIQSVTQTLVRNTANINSLAESAENSKVDLKKVATDIQEIAQESESLLQINSVMQNIASQTNLLSMNAAIEAAHAGESGKGFAVVSDEIRKLAENSSKQSKTISTVLKNIKTMIDNITRSTGVVMERFSAMEQEVQIVSEQESQIRSAMQEQGEGSQQILEAVTQLNSVTSMVREESSKMTNETKEIMNQSKELKMITADVAGSMDEMSEGAEKIVDTMIRVQEITEENNENIGSLNVEVSRFKVD
ncbi:MAG: methyl-accepting chemotaxis protein [Treponema sp.]|nr:methyl-accepting chemotaxis protein [Treponema sp.]MCL2272993.1 methyl-accepting chemotaxis protein [Treponema sp.]